MVTRPIRPTPEELAVDHDLPPPGRQRDMRNPPQGDMTAYIGCGRLSGRCAVVTGGDSGIGRAVAIAMALEGAKVVIAYNESDDDALDVVDLISARGCTAIACKCDVTRGDDRQRLVSEAVNKFGSLDVLVNNAAFFGGDAPFGEVTEDQLRQTYEVNVFAYFLLAQEALPYLVEAQGSIINTSSTTSILGKKGSSVYSSTKGAVNVLTKSLALELAEHGIRVNAVLPGPFWTPSMATLPREIVAGFGDFTTLKRPGQPDEIAPVYVLLAADNGYINGSLYEVNGGFESIDR